MTSFLVHLCWSLMFFVMSLMFFVMSLMCTMMSMSFSFSMDIFSSWFMSMSFSFSMDIFSSWFSFVVSFISTIIMLYSYYYMSPYSKTNYFIWMTIFFVLSMLMVINLSDFFFLMLGWDGLGLVSFFLIVYYQNSNSINSGLFTVLMNRVGDCFFIVAISLMTMEMPFLWEINYNPNMFLVIIMVLTFFTKSAIFPFSPWLPMAMAAPTPISALVHSSTLVTAGLYLSMRFYFMLYHYNVLMEFFLVMSIFTSFYAGLNSIFEKDLKKLIALSTLSHLGFIGMSYSCGMLYLSFFHLLTHALFKSVLFMSMGDIMTSMFHSQDMRFLSSGYLYTPMSFYIMSVSLMNLLGLPSLSGYFSKDMIIETCNFSNISFILLFFIYLNILFTYYYTYQLFCFSFSVVKFSPYIIMNSFSVMHICFLLILSLFSIFFGFIWLKYIMYWIIHVSVPLVWKMTPYLLNLIVFIYMYMFLNLLNIKNSYMFYYFSNMMFLSTIMMTLISNMYIKSFFLLVKSVEAGFFNYVFNEYLSKMLSICSINMFKYLYSNTFLMILFMFITFITLFIFI